MVGDKILDKIKKLKALGTSDNENEAMRSLEVMQKLMDKHNITDEMLNELNKEETKADTMEWVKPNGKSMRRWEINLASAIAKLFDCQVIIQSRTRWAYTRRNTKRKGILFIGVGDDKIIASEMYDYVREVLHNEGMKSLSKQRDEYNEIIDAEPYLKDDPDYNFDGRAFINSFMVGATNRIDYRIDLIIEKRRQSYQHNCNTTALTIINKKIEKVKEKVEECSNGTINTGSAISSMTGYSAGQDCGNNISLDNQITKKRNDLGQELLK